MPDIDDQDETLLRAVTTALRMDAEGSVPDWRPAAPKPEAKAGEPALDKLGPP